MTIPTTDASFADLGANLNLTPGAEVPMLYASPLFQGASPTYSMNDMRGKVASQGYYSLIKFDGTNGSTSFPDYAKTFVCNFTGSATISTAQSRFNGASLYTDNTSTGFVLLNSPSNMPLASYSGDWTIEFFVFYINGGGVSRFISGFAGTVDSSIRFGGNALEAYYFEPPSSTFRYVAANLGSRPTNTWFHVAFVKQGTNLYLCYNGNRVGSTTCSSTAMAMNFFAVGNPGSEFFTGYLDEMRFSNFARYTEPTYPVPTQSYITTLQPYAIEYLVVGGGGSGGDAYGGGGAGGYVATTGNMTPGTAYTVTVGAGGASFNSNGAQSSFNASNAGGGRSDGGGGGSGRGGNPGLSGGGVGTTTSGGNLSIAGVDPGTTQAGGGGGGAGAGGSGGSTFGGYYARGGPGGAGLQWLNGVVYAGGGGGGALASYWCVPDGAYGGAGGSGGGGNGGSSFFGLDFGSNCRFESYSSSAGAANRGGGGGAGPSASSGGSGIVVIRYPGAQRGTGGTITSSGGFTYHTFNSSGTYTA